MEISTLNRIACFFMAIAAFTFAACDDDNNNDPDPSSDDPLIGKYEVTNSDLYRTIELTEGGNYIITLFSDDFPETSSSSIRQDAVRKSPAGRSIFGGKKAVSRADEDRQVLYGTYTRKQENVYLLVGFGTLEATYDNTTVTAFRLTPDGESPVQLTVDKEDTYTSDKPTNKLCRTWNIISMREVLYLNGEVVTDKTVTPYDPEAELAKQVLFSKAGTYLLSWLDGSAECANWKWKSQSDWTISYSFDDEWYENAWASLKFSGEKLTIIEDQEIDADVADSSHMETLLQAAD